VLQSPSPHLSNIRVNGSAAVFDYDDLAAASNELLYNEFTRTTG
jgi:hypothetical protein